MNFISDILYWISTGLLVPVVVLLILLFCRSLLLIGVFLGEYFSSRQNTLFIEEELQKLDRYNVTALYRKLSTRDRSLVVTYLKRLIEARGCTARCNRLLAEFEIEADKNLSTSKTLNKMGPMLGLMGTLIPMGPALVGLSTGDIASMAYNMQVAFATTVIGLFSAAIGFITLQVKQRWYLRDIAHLEYVAELLNKNHTEIIYKRGYHEAKTAEQRR